MKKNNIIQSAAILAVACLIVCAPLHADEDEDTGAARRPAGDPFKPLIEQKEPTPTPTPSSSPSILPPDPPRVDPPVDFSVQAIASDRAQKVAVIEYQGQIYIVQDGTDVPEKGNAAFTVKKVTDSQVSVYDPRVKRLVNKQLVER